MRHRVVVRGAAALQHRRVALSGRCFLAQPRVDGAGEAHTRDAAATSYVLLTAPPTAAATPLDDDSRRCDHHAPSPRHNVAAAAASSSSSRLMPAALSGNGYYAQRYAAAAADCSRNNNNNSNTPLFVQGDVLLRLAHSTTPRSLQHRRVVDVTGVCTDWRDASEHDRRARLTPDDAVRAMHLYDGHEVPVLRRGSVAVGRVCVHVVHVAGDTSRLHMTHDRVTRHDGRTRVDDSDSHDSPCRDDGDDDVTHASRTGRVVPASRVRAFLRPLANANVLVSRADGGGVCYDRDSRGRGKGLLFASHEEAMALARRVAEHCARAAEASALVLCPVVRDGDVVALRLAPARTHV